VELILQALRNNQPGFFSW